MAQTRSLWLRQGLRKPHAMAQAHMSAEELRNVHAAASNYVDAAQKAKEASARGCWGTHSAVNMDRKVRNISSKKSRPARM